MENGDTILKKHFLFLAGKEAGKIHPSPKPSLPPEGIVWDEVEKAYLEEALRVKKGNKIQAARILGITRSALLYRMDKHGLK
jgi:two-component system NtrC family response regulator